MEAATTKKKDNSSIPGTQKIDESTITNTITATTISEN
jgi:hypothetical protein